MVWPSGTPSAKEGGTLACGYPRSMQNGDQWHLQGEHSASPITSGEHCPERDALNTISTCLRVAARGHDVVAAHYPTPRPHTQSCIQQVGGRRCGGVRGS